MGDWAEQALPKNHPARMKNRQVKREVLERRAQNAEFLIALERKERDHLRAENAALAQQVEELKKRITEMEQIDLRSRWPSRSERVKLGQRE